MRQILLADSDIARKPNEKTNMGNGMATGKVKWFDASKGYGFIKPDDGSPDVFVHLSEVMKAKLPHLRPDVPIAYSLEVEGNKRSAKELSSLSASAVSASLGEMRDDPLTDFADEFEKEWGLRQA
jgi:CspA family cold shock protein